VSGVDKFYVCLRSIVKSQIADLVGNDRQIITSEIDTKTNLDWHSFRRDGASFGRNLSFITSLGV
jgi:copper oxidase (laccase) domain-containing protein